MCIIRVFRKFSFGIWQSGSGSNWSYLYYLPQERSVHLWIQDFPWTASTSWGDANMPICPHFENCVCERKILGLLRRSACGHRTLGCANVLFNVVNILCLTVHKDPLPGCQPVELPKLNFLKTILSRNLEFAEIHIWLKGGKMNGVYWATVGTSQHWPHTELAKRRRRFSLEENKISA